MQRLSINHERTQKNTKKDVATACLSVFEIKKDAYPIDTPEFAAVIEVWERYWKDGSGMNQDAIVAELMENGRFTKKRAEAIEMICRPEDARGGGRKKSK